MPVAMQRPTASRSEPPATFFCDLKRLAKAGEIVQSGQIRRLDDETVAMSSDTGHLHTVRRTEAGDEHSCIDRDVRRRPCKHLYAARLFGMLERGWRFEAAYEHAVSRLKQVHFHSHAKEGGSP